MGISLISNMRVRERVWAQRAGAAARRVAFALLGVAPRHASYLAEYDAKRAVA